METVTPQLQSFMQEQSVGVDNNFVKATRDMGGLLVMDVGPRGGGKTTKATWLVQDYKEREYETRRVANVPIENANYVPNILKFLATKLIAEGGEKPYEVAADGTIRIIPRKTRPAKMLVIVDETAISGLEARGSGLYPLNTYLLALSRKLNVDCELISQLMSMADKRAQWLSDYYCLCESIGKYGFFRYKYFDAEYRPTTKYKLSFDFAQKHLFPKFDTTDIPNYDDLSAAFRAQFNITEDDMALYEDIKDGRAHKFPETLVQSSHEETFLSRKALRQSMGRYPGETVLKDGKRYEVLQRDWEFDEGQYRYRVREISDVVAQQSSMDEAGVEPIEDDGQMGGTA